MRSGPRRENLARRAKQKTPGPRAALRRLERIKTEYGSDASLRKRALLRALERGALPRPSDVLNCHEVLCFLRAYPDDEPLLAAVERLLAAFSRRKDLRRHREVLADSGISGTPIDFRFFQPTASWLASRWGDCLRIDWKHFKHAKLLERWLPLLSLYSETPGLDEFALGVDDWIARMKGPRESDAAYLIRRFDALRVDPFVREKLYDEIDLPIRLLPGPETPSRTLARYAPAPVVFQAAPLVRSRPDLLQEARRPPVEIRTVSSREARGLIDLAREAMITRSRDLDVFSWASPDDIRLVDCGGGLQFACIGALPERRLMLEAVYGFLTLKNGVPIGYVLTSALFGSSEIAYNVFETYRGGEAALVYGRVLAMTRHLFGVDSFTIYPYQLGDENPEAIRSGAWWFYQKLGFEPRDRRARNIMRGELSRMRRDSEHRSSRSTLEKLARSNLFFHIGRPREDVIGRLALPEVGLKVTTYLAERFGSKREESVRVCSREAAGVLGVRSLRGLTRGERLAWDRWSPLVLILPGIERWSAAHRRALFDVVRAKGGRSEIEFVRLFDRHRPLRRAVRSLAEDSP
jgi:hypothetical protein